MSSHRRFNRRYFCSMTAALPGLSMAGTPLFAQGFRDKDPHFFLNVVMQGGIDSSYLFDARPLAFTDAGKIQNYLYRNADSSIQVLKDPAPTRWQGVNGGTTFVTPLVKGFEAYRSDFSIVNGVIMLTNGLEGHDQNGHYLFCGQSTVGDSFVPMIGQVKALPMESVQFGEFGNLRSPTNFAGSAVLPGSVSRLVADLKKGPSLDPMKSTSKFIESRLIHNSSEPGLFAEGSQKLLKALQRTPQLANSMKAMEESPGESGILASLNISKEYFSLGITNCITIMIDLSPQIDTHDVQLAQNQLQTYQQVSQDLLQVLAWLKTTAFDAQSGKSMMDVTTLMISSEFSRTMRQDTSVDATGTDHNPLSNSVLLAGKGIRGGQIIGSTDLDSLDEKGEFSNVSKVHHAMDPRLLRAMGKPMDMDQLVPKQGPADSFIVEDYLGFPSIINSIFSLAGVKEDLYFRMAPGITKLAPVLKKLLNNV